MAAPLYKYQTQIVDENGNVLGTVATPLVTSGGGGGGGGASTIADGADVNAGAIADAVVAAGAAGSLSAKFRALSRDTGALTESAPGTDTASSGLNGRLQRIAQRITTLLAVFPTTIDTNSGNKSASTLRVVLATDQVAMTNAQPVTPSATEVHLGSVGGTTLLAAGTMTRTSDTNVYTAGDGVTTATSSASAMSVTNAARVAAGSGIIFGGRFSMNSTTTTLAQFRGWIYQGTPSAIPNDNAAFAAAVHADYLTLVGTFTADLTIGIVGSDGTSVPIVLSRPNMAYKLASGTSLTVILEARAAYVPTSAEVFRLVLDTVQD